MIAKRQSVVLIERESSIGYHSSGRSAALFSETYGNAVIRALSVAGRPTLEQPPDGFARAPLLTQRGALHFGTEAQAEQLDRLCADGRSLVSSLRRMTPDDVCTAVPVLRASAATGGGVLEPDARDIDTNELMQTYLRWFRSNGGQLLTSADVTGLEHSGARWRIATRAGEVRARVVVNAAGGWADQIAELARLRPMGLTPCRRTAFVFRPEGVTGFERWPLMIRAGEDLYFKPDAGALLVSPADETPVPASDVQPEEIDIATAAHRFETITDLQVARIQRSWAGLRTFAPDRTPVVGFAPEAEGFFWLAGQGGYGFQTAPALAAIAAALVDGRQMPARMRALGLAESQVSPRHPASVGRTETIDTATGPETGGQLPDQSKTGRI